MPNPHLNTFLRAALAGIAALLMTAAFAADSSQHKVVHGVAIYLGVFPAEMILGHPKPHTEAEMHGGVPGGQHQQHVVVALFDNVTGKRITGARVKANVSEIGLSGVQKKLEPMLIAGTASYGNYFNMPATNNPYRIQVRIELPGVADVIEAQFDYQHARA
jgi:opacity protein-like surface antigen